MKTRKSTNIFKETKLFHSIFLHQKCASKTTKIKTKRNAPNCIKHLCISCFSIAITGLYVNETINIKPTLMLFQTNCIRCAFVSFLFAKKCIIRCQVHPKFEESVKERIQKRWQKESLYSATALISQVNSISSPAFSLFYQNCYHWNT